MRPLAHRAFSRFHIFQNQIEFVKLWLRKILVEIKLDQVVANSYPIQNMRTSIFTFPYGF